MAADVLHEARDDFDPATARSAELLQNQLDRFEALLTDLLEISRFDAGAAVLERRSRSTCGVRRTPRRRGGRAARPSGTACELQLVLPAERGASSRSTRAGSSGSCAT